MDQEQKWRAIDQAGNECGPYSAERLRAYAIDGTITPTTQVWTEGLPEWIPASQVEGLFDTDPRGPRLLTGPAVPGATRQGAPTSSKLPSGRPESMFKKLSRRIRSKLGEDKVFDPSSLDDPLAVQIEWTPAKGANSGIFRPHKLVQVDRDRLEFRPTIWLILFLVAFSLMGIGLIFQSFQGPHKFGLPFDVIEFGGGILLGGMGGRLLYSATAPVVFDKRKGLIWKGRKALGQVFDKPTKGGFADLKHIHALQLITASGGGGDYSSIIASGGEGDDSSSTSYELNLVLKDGKRINVVAYSNEAKLKSDAERLSVFLEKPVWDAI